MWVKLSLTRCRTDSQRMRRDFLSLTQGEMRGFPTAITAHVEALALLSSAAMRRVDARAMGRGEGTATAPDRGAQRGKRRSSRWGMILVPTPRGRQPELCLPAGPVGPSQIPQYHRRVSLSPRLHCPHSFRSSKHYCCARRMMSDSRASSSLAGPVAASLALCAGYAVLPSRSLAS
jgi:hypothetical protein